MRPLFRQWQMRNEQWSRDASRAFQKRDAIIAAGGLLLGVGVTAMVLASRSPEPVAPPGQNAASANASPQTEESKTENNDPPPVKIIGASTEAGRPCEEQTWPYIDRNCLVEAPPKSNEMPAPAANKQETPPRQPVSTAAETTGVVTREMFSPRAAAPSEITPKPVTTSNENAPKTEPVKAPDEVAPGTTKAAGEHKPAGEIARTTNETAAPQGAKSTKRDQRRAERKLRRNDDAAMDEVEPGNEQGTSVAPAGRRSQPQDIRRSREIADGRGDEPRQRVIIEQDTAQEMPRRERAPSPLGALFPFFGGGGGADDD